MTKIRVYFLPKGYKDFICDSVTIEPILGGHKATVNGGKHDGEVIKDGYGARVIKENVDEE